MDGLAVTYNEKIVPIKTIRYDHKQRCKVIVLDNDDGTLLPLKSWGNDIFKLENKLACYMCNEIITTNKDHLHWCRYRNN